MEKKEEGHIKALHLDGGKEWRGGQLQVFYLLRGLQEQGVESLLVCPPGTPLFKRASEAGIRVQGLRMRGEVDVFAVSGLKKLVQEFSPQLLHCHTAHAHSLALLASRGTQLPVVVARRVDFKVGKNLLSRRKYLHGRVFYIAISEGVKRVLVEGGVPEERLFVVHSGVDPQRFSGHADQERVRRALGLPGDAKVVGNVAQLTDHKGHRYLIEAAAIVVKEREKVHFVIVGEGEQRPRLQKQITRLGLGEKVQLVGNREEIEDFFALFELFALSSHLEGLCTSLLDAMLLGVPVIATDVGGVPEIVKDGETGLLVPARDGAALARAILRLIDDEKQKRELAGRAKQWVKEGFSVEGMVQGTVRAYKEILNR